MERDTAGEGQVDQKTRDEILADVLREAIFETVPRDSVVIFRVPKEALPMVAEGVAKMHKLFQLHNITAICAPDTIQITVIPAGTPRDRIQTGVLSGG